MTGFVVGVFALTYLGMALGRAPGLRIDRTGIALIAVTLLLAAGAVEVETMGAAIDLPTLVLLFALMIVSAQFAAAGLYDLAARAVIGARLGPSGLLALTVVIGGGLSAVLANDIVVYALTPLLCRGLRGRGLDPRPFLIALAAASNAGSAATLIGNPQNILIGQRGGLDFWRFAAVCTPPALFALLVVFVVVRLVWREVLVRPPAPANPTASDPIDGTADRWQIAKGTVATMLLVVLFTTPVPREVGALAIAAMLLASRRLASRAMIGAVDWHLLLLFACLFIVTGAFADTGLARSSLDVLAARGLWPDRLAVLAPLALVASNGIGNVPAVILLMAIWPAPPVGALYGLALLSTLAGNLLLVGSLANIIVAERARAVGVTIGFVDFARAGIPIALVSMLAATLWLGWTGLMPWT
jgi:Na+/H+ antiporter NhaD/arsenite permease-like protein